MAPRLTTPMTTALPSLLLSVSVVMAAYPSATCPGKELRVVLGQDGELPYSSLDAKPIVWVGPECLGIYTGSPSILKVNGEWLVSHDFFGTTSFNRTKQLFSSRDEGRSWSHRANVSGIYWSSLFAGHDGTLYMIGNDGDDTHKVTPPNTKPLKGGPVVITKSIDNGYNWTTPTVLLQGSFQTGPTPVVVHNGTVYRSMEESTEPSERYSHGVTAFVMWARADADLTQAASWHRSTAIAAPRGPNNESLGWQEGSVVVSPQGQVWNMLRVNGQTAEFHNKAAATVLETESGRLEFKQWVDGAFGSSKIMIRRDEDGRYIAMSNLVTAQNVKVGQIGGRNTLVLSTSVDLISWRVCETVLEDDTGLTPADSARLTGFEYPDWQFDGKGIVAAVRTAYKGASGSGSSNFETLVRVPDYKAACGL